MDPDYSDIPEHESPVRRMIADHHGLPFRPLKTLEEARAFDDGVVILQGDWGSQIYAVIPAARIRCSLESLHRLLRDLDGIAWACNDGEGAAIYYERCPVGSGVAGGMGGGAVTGDIWIHGDFGDISEEIRDVISGNRESVETGNG